uniref:Uncharacterized protein n=2 Tax=Oryza sativa subsp. japonica TaxID=39947 RepID=Q6AT59_ORYSJ|nr:hypothetical protein [Oryza sativa Japonica Group]AAT78827.1 hypothetical protein [Oryza sativa Japonica Group]ABF97967.1 hypothetical protein LOC_Os03g45310 [Oryza sativa Japonica Group]
MAKTIKQRRRRAKDRAVIQQGWRHLGRRMYGKSGWIRHNKFNFKEAQEAISANQARGPLGQRSPVGPLEAHVSQLHYIPM